MIYLDNSASTLIKPKSVQKSVLTALNTYSANPGRSGHKQAIKTAMQVEEVRQHIARHLNTLPEKITFSLNCTDSLNTAIFGTHKIGGHVVCTCNEHNSVLRPLHHLQTVDKDFSFSIAEPEDGHTICWNDIKKHINEKTYLVVCNHVSNVNGDVANIEEIGQNLQKRKILFLVDAAQGGGHFFYDMQKQNINLLALAPHKGFYAPQGVGCLAINGDFEIQPFRFGGTGSNSHLLEMPNSLPEKLEAGTLNTPAILGFGEGVTFVEENWKYIQEKIEDLTTYLHYEFSKLPLEIYTKNENSCGVFAFNIPTISSADVSNFLDQHFDICTRSGLHCAPLKHKHLGTQISGAVRVSISYFNTYQEIERLVFAVKHMLKTQKKTLF